MIYELALASYLTTTTADIVSGVHARNVGAREIVLPQSPTAQIVLSGAISGLEIAGTRYLWTHNHKVLAVVLLAGSSFGHGWAAKHNWQLRKE